MGFQSTGTAVATVTTTLALVAPALQAGDIMVAIVATNDNTAPTGFNARWNTLYSATNTAALMFNVYWMKAGSSDSGATFNFTVAGTTVAFGSISAYRGYTGLGASSSSVNASSATVTWATMTNQVADSLIVAVFGYAANGATDGGISAGTPTFTNRAFSNTATGNTEAIGLYDGQDLVIGATGSRTMVTGAAAAVNTGVMFELQNSSSSGKAGGKDGGIGTIFGPDMVRNGFAIDFTRASPKGLGN